MMKESNKNKLIIILILIIISMTICVVILTNSHKNIICPQKFPLISPDLNCTENIQDQTYYLRDSVKSEVDKYLESSYANKISVFYRDLNNRQWFGVNENESFIPGSLLKLPLAILYFKFAEIDPSIFDAKFKFEKPTLIEDSNLYNLQNIKPEEHLEVGKLYSTPELVERMLKYSDNEAVPILVSQIGKSFFDKVYIDLGIFIPSKAGMEKDFLSVKTYGAILRSLYNASYINQKSSNEILEIMTQSYYKSGIAAGLPQGIKIANKFGERYFVDNQSGDNIFELHDCGIVYTDEPYILCVMTEGKDMKNLEKVISGISEIVYKKR